MYKKTSDFFRLEAIGRILSKNTMIELLYGTRKWFILLTLSFNIEMVCFFYFSKR
jgi:hypothetical protein